ncbi:lantibiotic transport ATP-binding protein SpaF/MutF [Bacillus sp. JCM 19045]|nr:lantibiotic transport ATP-binding protein SpaF/MutF [Bacillus sp. JCM 19045]
MSEVIIEVKQLSKTFKTKTAVKSASFSIAKGDIFGLIGPNGAGKSTLLKMIGGLVCPSSGEIQLFNRVVKRNHAYFERMGLLIEEAGLYPQYTASDNLNLIALSYGLKDRKKYIASLLKRVGLEETNKTKVKNYSMGMKQRLGIAIALIGSPDVLILDEPINGLDPQGISEMRKLIVDLNKKGITIILSSHILEELSKVATKYAILHHGEIIDIHTKDELLQKCEDRIELTVSGLPTAITLLENQLNIKHYKVIDDQTIYLFHTDVKTEEIIRVLVENGLSVHSITTQTQSLEQYFLRRTSGEEGSLV